MDDEKIEVKITERESRPDGDRVQDRLDSVLANFEAAIRIYDAVRERLSCGATQPPPGPIVPPIVPGVVPSDVVKRAQAALANFVPSRVPTEIRADPTYLAPGNDLKTSQKAVIQRNLTKFSDSPTTHSIRMSLSDEVLALLENVTTDGGGVTGGTIDLGKLLSLVESRMQGNELYAIGNAPAAALAAEAEADRRIKQITNPGD